MRYKAVFPKTFEKKLKNYGEGTNDCDLQQKQLRWILGWIGSIYQTCISASNKRLAKYMGSHYKYLRVLGIKRDDTTILSENINTEEEEGNLKRKNCN